MAKKGIASEVLQRQDKDGMLRRALERIIQLYTDKSHFVYELLQNAEDAGASKIKFLQYPDRLVVLHDGHPFSMENLQGLCDIGKSDKINDLNQIGEFGVGFKSVFGICDKVQLFSHPTKEDVAKGYTQFAVEILDFTHPVDIDDQEVDAARQVSRLCALLRSSSAYRRRCRCCRSHSSAWPPPIRRCGSAAPTDSPASSGFRPAPSRNRSSRIWIRRRVCGCKLRVCPYFPFVATLQKSILRQLDQ